MPRLDEKFLDCTVYLYPTPDEARKGDRIGASGFLAAIPAKDHWLIGGRCPQLDFHHTYAVSNRHVVEKNPVVRLNTRNGQFEVLSFNNSDWVVDDANDIAVAPVPYSAACKYLFVSIDVFVTKQLVKDQDVGIGDETFMVGRLVGHDGKQRNLPSLRFGHISMMPFEPVYHPSNPSQRQESFLVEVHSILGYSGSPVFVRPFPSPKLPLEPALNTVVYSSGTAMPSLAMRSPLAGGPWLLGVDWGYINSHDQGQNNTGMSAVVPAWYVRDLLETESLRRRREQEQKDLQQRFLPGTLSPRQSS